MISFFIGHNNFKWAFSRHDISFLTEDIISPFKLNVNIQYVTLFMKWPTKVFIGRLWYRIAGDSRETDYGSGNAVIGIRG